MEVTLRVVWTFKGFVAFRVNTGNEDKDRNRGWDWDWDWDWGCRD